MNDKMTALPGYGVRGVYAKELVQPVAQVMKEIGYKKAIVMHGLDKDGVYGMDEASTLGTTIVAELKENGDIENYYIRPEDLGIKPADRASLTPLNNLHEEAHRFIGLLSGHQNGPCTDIICLNAAFILYLMDVCTSFAEGLDKSRQIIASGLAIKKLRDWVSAQNTEPGKGLAKLDSLLSKTAVSNTLFE